MWVKQDAVELVLKRLQRAFSPADIIADNLPPRWTPRDGPRVVIVSDGVPHSSRGWVREVVRITVHCGDLRTANRILDLIDGHLTKPTPTGWAFSIKPATNRVARPDSRIGGYVASAAFNVATNRKVA
ncbi:hypothetical protein [Corynebacterium ulcerans]|uniref:hypothetical protein n=1 Tax=Corynebacterium ulcerans TaxID=65058 RepID=UPI0018D7FB5D|nr:hypothetical protein [Corynebacterium ulcerans]MBH5296197.1 hypothetical protein [Corynebacterium ulcerans]